jgi:transcriptional regulator with PAS, ATPase and Fis domain
MRNTDRLLFAWIGFKDIKASEPGGETNMGPIARALVDSDLRFARVVLLHNAPKVKIRAYLKWLKAQVAGGTRVESVHRPLSSPVDFEDIYKAAAEVVGSNIQDDLRTTFHLSPGTSVMAAVWIILSKTRFLADVLQSSREHGVHVADIPFDLSAEFIPDITRAADERLRDLSAGNAPEVATFGDIVYRSAQMRRVVSRSRRAAIRSIPILIEGESGTGKELFAKAIHAASPRHAGPFVAVNCGAIPEALVESELFGHKKGAFTGAVSDRVGYFEAANKGTLFLDEVGELPLGTQVKLLRVVQERQVVRLSESTPRKINIRIVAATNRKLQEEVIAGRFREDLFHRLAVAVIQLPPLRERRGDFTPLINHLLGQVNEEAKRDEGDLGFTPKKLSSGARNVFQNHSWPGNVRELLNALRRAAVWTEAATITVRDAREALLSPRGSVPGGILNRELGPPFSLPDLVAEVETHYLRRAIEEANGSKTKAAELVGLASYQTLTNWLKRRGLAL